MRREIGQKKRGGNVAQKLAEECPSPEDLGIVLELYLQGGAQVISEPEEGQKGQKEHVVDLKTLGVKPEGHQKKKEPERQREDLENQGQAQNRH